jgi:RecA/RadA recombinase
MAKKKTRSKTAKPDKEPGPLDIDKLIEKECKGLKLAPTNLKRGNNVKDAVSTGSLALDLILGGGWAPGRRSNVFGREAVGKSTLIYYAIKAAIAQGIRCLFFDFEGATDADRVERIGVRIDWADELKRKEPILFRYFDTMKSGEQMFRLCHRILQDLPDKDEGQVQLAIFLDSLPTVVPEAQRDNDESNANAMRASLFSSKLPLVKSLVSSKRCAWIDVNQLRTKPQVMFGNPEYEPCGEAVRTQSDCRVKASKTIAPKGRGPVKHPKGESKYIETESCWDGRGQDRYNQMNLYCIKNKGFSPNRGCSLRIWFEEAGVPGRGIDPVFDVYEYLRLTGQIRYSAKMLWIDLPPFNEEREVKVPVWDDKAKDYKHDPETGEIEFASEVRKNWTWLQLKQLILDPEATKGKGMKKYDITAACRKQLNDESAWGLYFEHQMALNQASSSDDEEED